MWLNKRNNHIGERSSTTFLLHNDTAGNQNDNSIDKCEEIQERNSKAEKTQNEQLTYLESNAHSQDNQTAKSAAALASTTVATMVRRTNSSLKKAPEAPKRFKSAFIFFSAEKHKEIRAQMGDKGRVEQTSNISKLVSIAWKELRPEEKVRWEAMALSDKTRYEVEKTLYKGPWHVPRRRTPKDSRAPKRPMSSFLAFANSRRASIKERCPSASNGDVSKMLASMWKAAPQEVRQPYIDEERQKRQFYKRAMSEWRQEDDERKRLVRHRREQKALRLAQNQGADMERDASGDEGDADVSDGSSERLQSCLLYEHQEEAEVQYGSVLDEHKRSTISDVASLPEHSYLSEIRGPDIHSNGDGHGVQRESIVPFFDPGFITNNGGVPRFPEAYPPPGCSYYNAGATPLAEHFPSATSFSLPSPFQRHPLLENPFRLPYPPNDLSYNFALNGRQASRTPTELAHAANNDLDGREGYGPSDPWAVPTYRNPHR